MAFKPRVTVLLPVYNGATTIDAAVQSILCQTFSDFELLVVDDGSTDDTPARLAAHKDERLRVLRTENRGLGAALKYGVEESRGELIARMDADDISAPNRLEREIAALDAHPEIGVVHARIHFMDRRARPLDERRESVRLADAGDNPTIHRWRLLWRNTVVHSTVLMRRQVLIDARENYIEGAVSEDYDLWSRLLFHTSFLRLTEPLLWHRVHPDSVTAKRGEDHVNAIATSRIETLSRITGEPVSPEIARDLTMLSGQSVLRPDDYLPRSTSQQLASFVQRALDKFIEAFHVGPEHVPELRHDAALQLLDWLWLLDRCPAPPAGGQMVLLRAAIKLDPWVLFSRKAVRHLIGLAIGPSGLKRLRTLRHAWAADRSGDGDSGA